MKPLTMRPRDVIVCFGARFLRRSPPINPAPSDGSGFAIPDQVFPDFQSAFSFPPAYASRYPNWTLTICDFGILHSYGDNTYWMLAMNNHQERYDKFRHRLREARVRAGLTQTRAAQLLGVDQSFVSRCESGERRVDIIELLRFSEVYQLPLSFFTEHVQEQYPGQA
jgi:DNA-binding XRE family transcriptional regulator